MSPLVALDDPNAVSYRYKRVSSDDQEKDGMSLPVQDDETRAYEERHPAWTPGGVFMDVETGANPTRGDYQRMLAKIRADRAAGREVRIIVVKQSRFGRDIEELARAWKDLVVKLGVQIHSTRDGGHLVNETMFLFTGVMDHTLLKTIGESVGKSLERFRRLGWFKPGVVRWGYKAIPRTKEQHLEGAPAIVIVPHPDEAESVRELFRRRAEGWSYQRLADWAQGLPERERGGRQLTLAGIRNALNSRTYIARCSDPKGAPVADPLDAPRGRWEPLCDDQTWRAIHPRAGTRENVVPIGLRSQYVLTHYIYCACGARMCGLVKGGHVRRRPGRREYVEPVKRAYMCASRMAGAEARLVREVDGRVPPRCHRSITADLIEAQVFDLLGFWLTPLAAPDARYQARRESRDIEQKRTASAPVRRLALRREERQQRADERARLIISLTAGAIDRTEYVQAKAYLDAEVDRLDAEIAVLEEQVVRRRGGDDERAQIDVLLDQATFWLDVIRRGTVDDRREMLRLLVDRLQPERVRPGEYRAGLRFTPLGEHLLQVSSGLLVAAGRYEEVYSSSLHYTLSYRPEDDTAAS